MILVVLELEIDIAVVHRGVEAEAVFEFLGDIVGGDAVPLAGNVRDAGAQHRVEDRRADLTHAAAGLFAVSFALINRVCHRPALLFAALTGRLVEVERLTGIQFDNLHHADRFRNIRVARSRHGVGFGILGGILEGVVGLITGKLRQLIPETLRCDLRLGQRDRRRQRRGEFTRGDRIGNLLFQRIEIDLRAAHAVRKAPVRLIIDDVVDLVCFVLDRCACVGRMVRDLLVQGIQRIAQKLVIEGQRDLNVRFRTARNAFQRSFKRGLVVTETDRFRIQGKRLIAFVGNRDIEQIRLVRKCGFHTLARVLHRQVPHAHARDRRAVRDHRVVGDRNRRFQRGRRFGTVRQIRIGHGFSAVARKDDRRDQHADGKDQKTDRDQQQTRILFLSASALFRRLGTAGRVALLGRSRAVRGRSRRAAA